MGTNSGEVQIWDASAGKKIRTMTYARSPLSLMESTCILTMLSMIVEQWPLGSRGDVRLEWPVIGIR